MDTYFKDKTVVRPSSVYNWNPYADKMASLEWDGTLNVYVRYDLLNMHQPTNIYQNQNWSSFIKLHCWNFDKTMYRSVVITGPLMTSSNGNIFRVTGPLWGETTGHRWIPLTKASDAELWCFLWSALGKRLSKLSRRLWFETPSLIMTSL